LTWKQKFIKRFVTLWIVLSFVLCPLSLFAVYNTYISIHDEVDMGRICQRDNPAAAYNALQDHLTGEIYGHYLGIGFFLINGVILLYLRTKIPESGANPPSGSSA
jgi:hypothetical protein